jgi:hypothetical protein
MRAKRSEKSFHLHFNLVNLRFDAIIHHYMCTHERKFKYLTKIEVRFYQHLGQQ